MTAVTAQESQNNLQRVVCSGASLYHPFGQIIELTKVHRALMIVPPLKYMLQIKTTLSRKKKSERIRYEYAT